MGDTPNQSYDELLAVLPAETRARVEAGELTVHQGQNPSKPVLRDAVTRALVKGTGRAPGAGDPIVASKAAAVVSFKRTASYQEAMDLLMSVDAPATVKGSFAWLYEKAMWAAEGAPQQVKMPCPHWYPVDAQGQATCQTYEDTGRYRCKHNHDYPPCQDADHAQRVMVLKPDGTLIFKLLELKHGRAKETVEVTGRIDVFAEVMEARDTPFLVYDITPEQEAAQSRAVDEVLEGDFRELTEAESASNPA